MASSSIRTVLLAAAGVAAMIAATLLLLASLPRPTAVEAEYEAGGTEFAKSEGTRQDALSDKTFEPRGNLPKAALGKDVVYGAPEGWSGGALTHQWVARGEVVELLESDACMVICINAGDGGAVEAGLATVLFAEARSCPKLVQGDCVKVRYRLPLTEEGYIQADEVLAG